MVVHLPLDPRQALFDPPSPQRNKQVKEEYSRYDRKEEDGRRKDTSTPFMDIKPTQSQKKNAIIDAKIYTQHWIKSCCINPLSFTSIIVIVNGTA